jgi:hypothetical protein
MTETQAVPDAVAVARRSLADVLAAEPDNLDVRLQVAQSLSQLEDVRPPYPPLAYDSAPSVDIVSEIQHAYRHLRKAIDTGDTVGQVMACSNAARTLRPLMDPAGQA